MKTKQTQIGAITEALINGEKLTALSCFKKFGSLRMSAKAFEIEKRYGIRLVKKQHTGKTRFGTSCYFLEYSMLRGDAKKVKRMMKESYKN